MRLSVCIPTYNRAPFLRQAIESVLSQPDPRVEVVVSDNGSTDGTPELLHSFVAAGAPVRVHRWERNVGPDRNFLKVIETADGDYCWLLGSDDRVEPGAIAYLLAILEANPDVTGVSVEKTTYSRDMVPDVSLTAGARARDEVRRFTDVSECFRVLGDYFGYLSGQVVRRDRWLDAVAAYDTTPFHNAYVHVYVIGQALKTYPSWMYLRRPLVGFRSGNDSFLADGRLRRVEIKVVGFERITRTLFGHKDPGYRSVQKRIGAVHVRSHVLMAKRQHEGSAFSWGAFRLTLPFYRGRLWYWTQLVPLMAMPAPVVRLLLFLYRATWRKARLRSLRAQRSGP